MTAAHDDGPEQPLQHGAVRFVPILHGHFEFANEVRRQIRDYRPDVVAVEYPVTLREPLERGVARLPLLSVVHYKEDDGGDVYALVEPSDGVVEAIRSAQEFGIPRAYVDRDTEGYPQHWESFPDSTALSRVGHAAFCEAYARHFDPAAPRAEEDLLREQTMAAHLQELAARHERVLFVCGLAHYPAVLARLDEPCAQPLARTRRDRVVLTHLHERSSRELLSDMPWLQRAWERARDNPEEGVPDRLALHEALVQEARRRHRESSGEDLNPNQRRVLFQFARNQALLGSRLAPDLYQLLVAARGAADDNFAWELWDEASHYPWQTDEPELPVLRLSWEDLLQKGRRFRFRRRLSRSRRRLVSVPVRQRPQERRPGQWKEMWQGGGIVSHPPEDIVVEGYGAFLKEKALEILSEERRRVLPMTTSLLDGVDVRETIRNWHEGRIYVRESRPVRGKVGSVVVIFDEDEVQDRYPWEITWLGEHAQESDMALYATRPDHNLVGPGVSRCEYGGFLLSYPPLRMFDVWQDPTFDGARSRPERLLLAGLDYSEGRYVVYVAARPPRSRMRSIAERLGKQIVYVPIGQLSPVSIAKIRVFHVLDGAPVRAWAKHFVR